MKIFSFVLLTTLCFIVNLNAQSFANLKIGKDSAPVVIYEYISLSCPACAVFQTRVMDKIKADYVSKGLVQIIIVDVVLLNPQLDFFSHGLLHTIKNQATAEKLMAILFENQQKWARSSNPKEEIITYARLLGVSNAEIEDAQTNQNLANWLKESNNNLKKIKFEGTPSIFILKNGDDILNYRDKYVGLVDYSVVKASIDKLLKK
jgi:protein-disulfide isomerase